MSQMRLKGKVAIITGATSGIGKATAILFGKEGGKVVVVGRRRAMGEETVKTIRDNGGEAIFVRTDVTKADEVERMVKTTIETYGKPDILFNNAGIAFFKEIKDMTEEEWDRCVDTGLKGTFLCTKYAIPHMIKQGGGSIINASSINGLRAMPGLSAYCAAKGGVIMFTKAIAVECGPYNIRANAICPGYIYGTELVRGVTIDVPPEASDKIKQTILNLHPLGRAGSPEEVARTVLFLASDESSFITGSVISVDGARDAQDGPRWT